MLAVYHGGKTLKSAPIISVKFAALEGVNDIRSEC